MKAIFILTLFLISLALTTAEIFFEEDFDDSGWESRWVKAYPKKSEGADGEWGWTTGKFYADPKNKGLQTTQDAKFYTISAKFPKEFSNSDQKLVVQYTVKFEQNIDCGGGYIKLFPASLDQSKLHSESEYNIMFGPDICGSSTRKVHVIFSHDGKNHLIKKNIPAETDEFTHIYRLVVNPDNTYQVYIDGKEKESGSLEEDWDILPPKQIPDPKASKPSDWVDEREIPDPEDIKPEGWDDIPAEIPDPDAKKPEDWDEELDGEWESPSIPNPEYKGEWKPKLIPNPKYQGEWVHPLIDNPDYKPNPKLYAYDSFAYLGIDVWQVKSGTIFDSFIITNSEEQADVKLKEWESNKEKEKQNYDQIKEEEAKRAEEERKLKEAETQSSDTETNIEESEPKDEL